MRVPSKASSIFDTIDKEPQWSIVDSEGSILTWSCLLGFSSLRGKEYKGSPSAVSGGPRRTSGRQLQELRALTYSRSIPESRLIITNKVVFPYPKLLPKENLVKTDRPSYSRLGTEKGEDKLSDKGWTIR